MNIIIQGASPLYNEGAVAMLISTIEIVKEVCPEANFFVPISSELLAESEQAIRKGGWTLQLFVKEGYGYQRILAGFALATIFGTKMLEKIFNDPAADIYRSADLIIDISGDTLSDGYGKINSREELLQVLFASYLGKKLVVFPQSIGPFHYWTNRLLAQAVFARARLVIPRESITAMHLKKLGIKTLAKEVVNDVAFWLKPLPEKELLSILKDEGILNLGKTLGISVSQSFVRFRETGDAISQETYIKTIIELIDFATDALGLDIILIPHVIGPSQKYHDDRLACLHVWEHSKNKVKVHRLARDYKAHELKGIISKCNYFVGARMHANIAALSSGVPTIAMSYSHKTEGVMSLIGLQEWVYRNFDESLNDRLVAMIQNEETIKEKLRYGIAQFVENRILLKRMLQEVVATNGHI